MTAPYVVRYSRYFAPGELEEDSLEEAILTAIFSIETNESCPLEIKRGDQVLYDLEGIRDLFNRYPFADECKDEEDHKAQRAAFLSGEIVKHSGSASQATDENPEPSDSRSQ